MADDPMWCICMFDLPTKTKRQRRRYSEFRNMLLDNGFVFTQLSVYAKYSPSGVLSNREVAGIKNQVPSEGEIRLMHISDRQWANTIRFCNAIEMEQEKAPEQLLLFN